VILSNHVLRLLADQDPHSTEHLDELEVLNEWEQREYGREVISLLRRQAHFR
jgi:ribonuclease D